MHTPVELNYRLAFFFFHLNAHDMHLIVRSLIEYLYLRSVILGPNSSCLLEAILSQFLDTSIITMMLLSVTTLLSVALISESVHPCRVQFTIHKEVQELGCLPYLLLS